jgi:glutamate/tyrosine decarboxylase-like PLP-dependent enzyme
MFEKTLQSALDHALTYLNSLGTAHVNATATLEELREKIHYPLTEEGIDPARVINDLVKDTEGGIVGSAGGRFFGWVIGGAVPAALAADWLTSTWDQNAALYAAGPAEAVIEEVCGEWLKDLFRLPQSSSFAFVTGCQMAHVTCLAAARNAQLAAQGWNVENDGLSGAPALKIVCGDQRHGTVERAVRFLGLGRNSIHNLPVTNEGTLAPHILENELKALEGKPVIVVLQAGDLNIGAFEPFDELIEIAHRYKAWVHVDGAFGLWANASPVYRHLLNGVEKADSWTSDGHKWLNVPYDCGYAFVKKPKFHAAAMSHRESYLIHSQTARDQIDWTPEFSRRGRAVASYAAIRQLGRSGIAGLIERNCRFARELVTGIGALEGAEVVFVPQLNQGLVRFLDTGLSPDHNTFTDKVMQAILDKGEAFFGGTTWRGIRCMRVSVSNWQTSENDVRRAVNSIREVLVELQEK